MLAQVAGAMPSPTPAWRLGEVDGVITEGFAEAPFMAPSTVVEYMGMKAKFAEVVDLGGATGAGMVWRAAAAIAAGMRETVLCLTAARREKPRRPAPGRRGHGLAGRRTDHAHLASSRCPTATSARTSATP